MTASTKPERHDPWGLWFFRVVQAIGLVVILLELAQREDPRYIVIADAFTHLAHHRGQLTVYLRLNGAAVPSVYGPSADDRSFGPSSSS